MAYLFQFSAYKTIHILIYMFILFFAEDYCSHKEAGLYTHPGAQHCFVQCDQVGGAHSRSCSPGTVWKQLGPEPAMYNYCTQWPL